MLVQADPGENLRYCKDNHINKVPETLDEKIWSDIKGKINTLNKNNFEYEIENTFRSVGTRLSHHVYKKFGNEKLNDETINIKLTGSAGQSLGFFDKRVSLTVEGDCNDYVGKGLPVGKLLWDFTKNVNSRPKHYNCNTVLYGATSGKLYASDKRVKNCCKKFWEFCSCRVTVLMVVNI